MDGISEKYGVDQAAAGSTGSKPHDKKRGQPMKLRHRTGEPR
jgi:hypothetical protein